MRVAVITANIGGYDFIKEIRKQTIDADFYCFTDNPKGISMWTPVELKGKFHSRLVAKRPKIYPYSYSFLKGYDWVIWVDASLLVQSETFLEDFIKLSDSEKFISLMPHPSRDCVYEEAEVSMQMPKYDSKEIIAQMVEYENEGLPRHSGLYACTVLVWNMSQINTCFQKEWLLHNYLYSYQDQLSFAFLCWQKGFQPGVIPVDLYQNKYFKFTSHKHQL